MNRPLHDFETLETSAAIEDVFPSSKKRDCAKTLRNLAGLQLQYGQVQNAEHLLLVARYIAPQDGDTLRVLAHVMARSGRAIEAGKMLMLARDAERSSVAFQDFKEIGMALVKQGHRALGLKFLAKKTR